MLAASRENNPDNWLFRITDCRTSDGQPVLILIHTNNITETNNLVHAGARMAVELMKKKKKINHSGKDAWKNS